MLAVKLDDFNNLIKITNRQLPHLHYVDNVAIASKMFKLYIYIFFFFGGGGVAICIHA